MSSELTPGIVIVGASAAGFNTAETLRREGHLGSITLIGDEQHLPYDRPSVSKRLLNGEANLSEVLLCSEEALGDLDIHYLAGQRATALDVDGHTLKITDSHSESTEIDYTTLVIATGCQARRWHGAGEEHTVTLRSADDSVALRTALMSGDRVVIIGAGILGYEIASAARKMGCQTTLVGRGPTLGFGGLGQRISLPLVKLLVARGVDLRLQTEVVAVTSNSAGHCAHLSDGSSVVCDIVIAAIGSEPAVDWLEGSGVSLADGVVCDAHGRAEEDVFAIGDVARWLDPALGTTMRVEHQMNAIEQGQAVGRYLSGGEPPTAPLPFYWSEIFETRIMVQGRFSSERHLAVTAGSLEEGRFVAVSEANGSLEGIMGWNMPREFRKARAELAMTRLSGHAKV